MQGREFLKQATAVAMRTGMPKINRDDLGLIWLSVPDIVEQARITAALDDWSSIQYSMDCLLDAKRRFKKALAQQLLTGKRRFPTASQEWRHPRTDEVFENVSRKNHGGDIVLSVTQDAGVVPRESLERKINMTAENTHTYKLVEPGDFVISLRSFQGGLEYSDHRGLVSPAYQVIRPKVDVIPTFYRHYFKSAEFIKRLAVAIIGIRDGKQISCGDFSFMRIPFPPANEQRRIADTLDAVDREIDILTRQVEALRRQKQGLMQQLLTGRARIPGGGE
jgi:type I restriction enzyme S subunit